MNKIKLVPEKLLKRVCIICAPSGQRSPPAATAARTHTLKTSLLAPEKKSRQVRRRPETHQTPPTALDHRVVGRCYHRGEASGRLERPECACASGLGLGPVEFRPVLCRKRDLPSAFPACHERTIRCGGPPHPGTHWAPGAPPGRGASSLTSEDVCPFASDPHALSARCKACRGETSLRGRHKGFGWGCPRRLGSQWERRTPSTTGGFSDTGRGPSHSCSPLGF